MAGPAISGIATWSVIFMSCIFSTPVGAYIPYIGWVKKYTLQHIITVIQANNQETGLSNLERIIEVAQRRAGGFEWSMDIRGPVDLWDTEDHLSWPVLHPLLARFVHVRLNTMSQTCTIHFSSSNIEFGDHNTAIRAHRWREGAGLAPVSV